jgi:transducin (beta)-like 1
LITLQISPKHIPRGELVELLTKALLYLEVESHWRGDRMSIHCKRGFSLLDRHECSVDPLPPPKHKSSSVILPSVTDKSRQPNGSADDIVKRKASASSSEPPTGKRPRRNSNEMDVDANLSAKECMFFGNQL